MLKRLLADTAFDVLMVLAAWNLHANDSTVTGAWHIIRDDRPETNALALAETADPVVGAWTQPNGDPRIILEEGTGLAILSLPRSNTRKRISHSLAP